MKIKLGIVMDPIANINFEKDTTLGLLWAAQERGCELYYFEQKNLFMRDGVAYGDAKLLRVSNNPKQWYEFQQEKIIPLHDLNVILMRKDPPFDMEFIFTTYLLEMAESRRTLVINKPQSLRDANEKLFTSWFPQCCPKTLVAREKKLIKEFLMEQGEIVLKPLDVMGGASIFHLHKADINANVTIETLTLNQSRYVMAQQYIPEVLKSGDKRILLLDGKPIPHALARIPARDDFRGNLASGAHGEGVALTERDYWICEQVGSKLRDKGLWFVGLDIIGDYLTEINVTSPTGLRQLNKFFDLKIEMQFMDFVEKKLHDLST